ncbi:ankyrin repeat domain-containing protein 37-like [Coregonus clupeaformis]|uniref:ankyrin repeat domain-containing protein 37-like n=1 Tax=Coregonus clupeaformis TaxID=59861 RepID=UPI001E1C63B7|nr:ankyrin repeat domain-containing protein 37 isoform X2 [Coregonus clupeaformis]XP_045074176.1 ankyrin repeat domain-containing protein 37-like [Coregonus clupeaformis]
MFLLDSDSQLDCIRNLFEGGDAVNSSNVLGQSPAHLAACSGQAFCLLWLLQTGADANQQDNNGETPMHKAAKAGSLECISVLVASDAQLGSIPLESLPSLQRAQLQPCQSVNGSTGSAML